MTKYSYGRNSKSHYVFAEVVDVENDPEQAGRVKVRIIGYQNDKANIPDEHLFWARPLTGIDNAMDGGIGGNVTGATKGTVIRGFFADADQQHLYFDGTISKSGAVDNNGKLDQNDRQSDINKHTRDEDHGGGDVRYDSEEQKYADKSILVFARDEAENPYNRRTSKDADEDDTKSWSLAQQEYRDV